MKRIYTCKYIYDFWLNIKESRVRSFSTSEITRRVATDWERIIKYLVRNSDEFGVLDFLPSSGKELDLNVMLTRLNIPIPKQEGTITVDSTELAFYKLTTELRKLFLDNEWYFWFDPINNPEDPFFLKKGIVFVTTIIHEGLIFFHFDEQELADFTSTFPDLELSETDGKIG